MQQPQESVSNEDRLRYRLALTLSPGIGPATFAKLLQQFDHIDAIFDADNTSLLKAGLSSETAAAIKHPDWNAVDAHMEWSQAPENHIVVITDTAYPHLLEAIDTPPPLLFVHGNIDVLGTLQLAVVGSRNPTKGGTDTARLFCQFLAHHGLTITSGLALGIDASAHEGALKAGNKTVAVMGTGLDRVYPARHRDLAHKIAEQGALISEYPLGTPPLPQNFPQRNRIISGLSLGVLVVEAAKRSGSLITARMALEQGRDVFAIPGSIHNPLSRGCHEIIRQGAKLVETGEHILEELGSLALENLTHTDAGNTTHAPVTDDSAYQNLLEQMGYDPITVDELVSRSGLTSDQLSSMLLLLELDGYVTPANGGGYCRSQKRQ
ncbi:MAG: DNA-processing protein DprA [Gammaproteobacteria bacterium]